MKIEILDDAKEDLIQGFRFYESRETGLGSYFVDCLISDIDSLLFFGGIHPIIYGYHRCLSKRFRLPFTIVWKKTLFAFLLCWIAAESPPGLETDLRRADD